MQALHQYRDNFEENLPRFKSSDVARESNNFQWALDRYLKDYRRVKTAYEYNPDIHYVPTVKGIAKHVVKEDLQFIHHDDF